MKRQIDARASNSCKSEGLPECEDIVKQMRRESKCYTWSAVLLKYHYVSFSATERILDDIVKLCIHENSTFVRNTTFGLADCLWLCDSSFQYEVLLNDSGEHPHFLSLYMLHFDKGCAAYKYSIYRLLELLTPF